MNHLNTIESLQQIIVNSLFGRLALFVYRFLLHVEGFWLSSRFHKVLGKWIEFGSKSVISRFFSGDPLQRLQVQSSSSWFATQWSRLGRHNEKIRLRVIEFFADLSKSSIVGTILQHLACPEGWQLSGLSRAGLAFLLGLSMALGTLGVLTMKKAALLGAIFVLFILWRNVSSTIREIWRDSLLGKLFSILLPDSMLELQTQKVVAPPLVGLSAYIMYGLLTLLGGVTGFLWIKLNSPLVLTLPLALAAVQLVFLRPAIGLWAVAFYAGVDWFLRLKANTLGLPNWWDEALMALMITALLSQWITRKDFRWRMHPTMFPLTAFISVMLFLFLIDSTYLRITVPIEGLRVVVQHMLWFYLAVQLLRSRSQASLLLIGFTLLCTGIAAYGVYQYIAKVPMPSNWVDQAEVGIQTRAYSIVGSPNILGSLLVLSTPIALGLAYRGTSWQRAFYLFCAALMAICMVFTFSRGAWLGLGFGIVLFGVLQDRRLIGLLLIGAILLPIAAPSVAERVSYLLSPDYFSKSAQGGRIDRWTLALEKVQENPLTGAGLGRFGGAAAEHNQDLLPHKTIYTDNYYLKTAAETGFVGLLAFVTLMVSVVRVGIGSAIHAPPNYRALATGVACGLVGVVLHNAVENVFEVPLMVVAFWLCVASVWVLRTEVNGQEAVQN